MLDARLDHLQAECCMRWPCPRRCKDSGHGVRWGWGDRTQEPFYFRELAVLQSTLLQGLCFSWELGLTHRYGMSGAPKRPVS